MWFKKEKDYTFTCFDCPGYNEKEKYCNLWKKNTKDIKPNECHTPSEMIKIKENKKMFNTKKNNKLTCNNCPRYDKKNNFCILWNKPIEDIKFDECNVPSNTNDEE